MFPPSCLQPSIQAAYLTYLPKLTLAFPRPQNPAN
jgi:hypothetical protein